MEKLKELKELSPVNKTIKKEKKVFFLIHVIPGHPELNRLVTGVWSTYEGAKLAFDHYKKLRPDFEYGIASYPVYENGKGLF